MNNRIVLLLLIFFAIMSKTLAANTMNNRYICKDDIAQKHLLLDETEPYFSGFVVEENCIYERDFKSEADENSYYNYDHLAKDTSGDIKKEWELKRDGKCSWVRRIVKDSIELFDRPYFVTKDKKFIFIDVDTCLLKCEIRDNSNYLTVSISIDPTKTYWQVNFETDSIYYSNDKGIWSFCYKDTVSKPVCIFKMNGVQRFYFDFSEKHVRGIIYSVDNRIVFYPERKVINSQKILRIVVICLIGFFCTVILIFIIWRLSYINFFKQIPKIIKNIFKPIMKEKNGKKRIRLIDYKLK